MAFFETGDVRGTVGGGCIRSRIWAGRARCGRTSGFSRLLTADEESEEWMVAAAHGHFYRCDEFSKQQTEYIKPQDAILTKEKKVISVKREKDIYGLRLTVCRRLRLRLETVRILHRKLQGPSLRISQKLTHRSASR